MADDQRPTEGAPGDEELQATCDGARKIVELCDLLGYEFRGGRHLVGVLEGALDLSRHRVDVCLQDLIDDPDFRPYIWDLED